MINFYTTCVEVTFHDFGATCGEVIFNLCPSWAEVGFWTSDQLGRRLFFIPDKLSGSWFRKFCPTWAELFFAIFPWTSSKNAFLVGYHLGRFFLKLLPKRPILSATTWRNILKNCSRSTHKKLAFAGYHLRKVMDKKHFSPATTWKKIFCAGYESECFFWRYMKKVFQNPLINRS